MHMIRRHALNSIRILLGGVFGLAIGIFSMAQPAFGQRATSKPVWPNNGVAQRMFPNGGIMFVENDRGIWRAWVLELKSSGPVQAMDFFSGQRMKVETDREADGRQDSVFTDAKGVTHVPEDKGFSFTGSASRDGLPGISFNGKALRLDSTKNNCSVIFYPVSGVRENNGQKNTSAMWSKVPIIHYTATAKSCSSGLFESTVTSLLDLDDGTFLAVQGCFVFRLRKSDLSPAGSAPALRVLDESAVQAAIDQAKGKSVQDATGYLAKALNLPTTTELSCKED